MKQLVYYQVLSLSICLTSDRCPHVSARSESVLTPGVCRSLKRSWCVQIAGRNVRSQPQPTHQRPFLPSSPPTISCLTNCSRRISVFDAELLVNCAPNQFSLSPYPIRSFRGSNLYLWFLSWRFHSSCHRRHDSENWASPAMQPRTVAVRVCHV